MLQVWITIAQSELTELQGYKCDLQPMLQEESLSNASVKPTLETTGKEIATGAAIQSTTSNRNTSNETPMLHQSVDQFTIYPIGPAQEYYVFLNGKQTLCVVDIGSQLNVIPKHLTDNLKLVPTNVILNAN